MTGDYFTTMNIPIVAGSPCDSRSDADYSGRMSALGNSEEPDIRVRAETRMLSADMAGTGG